MELDMEKVGQTLIIRYKGEIDMSVSGNIKDAIDREMDKERTKNLIINFKHVEFIDSSGLGMLLGRYKFVTIRSGKVAVTGANEVVHRLLDLSGLYSLMKPYKNERLALRALGEEVLA
ncbi:anti-sigma factor antagonist [Heliorestis acidaminivorans]|uniref:Anti-sigma factor antagonist n=1 Tax=Heliorestis acidaminivorans TaxID=553427 RepID=A0A6I0EX32_9FIRM|nr:anti-sigma factor antagonist [Heliorestis acidaminivorans]KAB2951703.1 anti-sigma factor antagonist [Heliorestis acidaminivorans]